MCFGRIENNSVVMSQQVKIERIGFHILEFLGRLCDALLRSHLTIHRMTYNISLLQDARLLLKGFIALCDNLLKIRF